MSDAGTEERFIGDAEMDDGGTLYMINRDGGGFATLHRFLDSQFQLEINTTTTIITFLMVALLQNSQTRTEQAVHHKLNAIADGLADLMEHMADQAPDSTLEQDVRELKAAVGLEEIESTS